MQVQVGDLWRVFDDFEEAWDYLLSTPKGVATEAIWEDESQGTL